MARFSEYVSKEYDDKQFTNLYCITHQEARCVKFVALGATLKEVNRIILYIRSNALYHQQFRELLQLSETSAEDILYHSGSQPFCHCGPLNCTSRNRGPPTIDFSLNLVSSLHYSIVI